MKIKKNKINISSSSYLFPEISEWNNLKKKYLIKFKEYNQYNLSRENSLAEIIIIFLEDIIEEQISSKKKYEENKRKINSLLKILSSKFIKEKSNHIICHSLYNFKNYVNYSKEKNLNILLHEYFEHELYKLSNKIKNLFILNLNNVFCHYGYNKIYDFRNYYLARCRLSQFGIEILQESLNNILERITKTNKKLLLLDCDNTIWGGVVSEDGFEKIKIGQDGLGHAHQDFQRSVKYLKNRGILIALVSKNIKDDVLEVLRKNKNMIIKEKDISILKVNWKNKATNILEISKELMLGMDSFVFWDDNPIERQNIKKLLPDVEVIEPDQDVSNWANQLLEYQGFSKIQTTKEDLVKTEQYKSRSSFLDNKKIYQNEIEYLQSINIKPKLISLNSSNIDRAVQMIQKTNQFNLSNIKYSFEDIKVMSKKDKIFMVDLKDIYGNHGLVSLIILKKIEKKIFFVDTFILSCRILGRYIENWVLQKVLDIANKYKFKEIIIKYKKTKKNVPAKNFLFSFKPNKIDIKKYLKEKKINNTSFDEGIDFYKINTNLKIKNSRLYD